LISGRDKRFVFSITSRAPLGTSQLPVQWVGGVSPDVKRLRREADHSPPTGAEVKKMWLIASTPPGIFTAQGLINRAEGQTCVLDLSVFCLINSKLGAHFIPGYDTV
jgi:hypothetical protein